MPKVICIIVVLSIFFLYSGCGESERKVEYQLPDSVEHPKPGKVNHITPEALIDSINKGVQMQIFFLKEDLPEDPAHIVSIPGMKEIPLGDIFSIAETLSTEKPIYLVCVYGDDSKKIAENIAVNGISSYYLDGGSYRLWKEMDSHGWSFKPQSTNPY